MKLYKANIKARFSVHVAVIAESEEKAIDWLKENIRWEDLDASRSRCLEVYSDEEDKSIEISEVEHHRDIDCFTWKECLPLGHNSSYLTITEAFHISKKSQAKNHE